MLGNFLMTHCRNALPRVGFIAALTACSGSGGTEILIPPPSSGIVTTQVGTLPSDNQSAGFAVNAAGHVVGQSTDGLTVRAYYWNGSSQNLTPQGMQAVAYTLSNGATEYAGGYQQASGGVRQAVRWTVSSPIVTSVLETSDSFVSGINDAGTAAGRYVTLSSAVHGAIWPIGQSRIDIPALPGYTNTAATDINNDGIVTGTAFGSDGTTDKAWVRFADGSLVDLTLPSGASGSSAFALSEVANGQFYVAGHVITALGVRSGARWTVQVATRSMTFDAFNQMTVASGVTSAGEVVGLLNSGAGSSALLVRNGVTTTLPAVGNAGARGVISGAAFYVVGDVFIAGVPIAMRWTIP